MSLPVPPTDGRTACATVIAGGDLMPEPRTYGKIRSRRFLSKNASAVARTNSTSNAVINRGRHSTTGFKLKKKFFGPKGTPLSTKHRKNLSPPVTLQRSSLTATRGFFQFVNIPEKPDSASNYLILNAPAVPSGCALWHPPQFASKPCTSAADTVLGSHSCYVKGVFDSRADLGIVRSNRLRSILPRLATLQIQKEKVQ
jgi:hypothetical protein